MSLLVNEEGRSGDFQRAQQEQLVRGFEDAVVDRFKEDKEGFLFIGIGIILGFEINPETRRPRVSIRPDFDSQVGFRFDPIGTQGIRMTLVDLTGQEGDHDLASRMVSIRVITSLNRLIRYPWRDPVTDATVATALTDQEREIIDRRGIRFQPPKL